MVGSTQEDCQTIRQHQNGSGNRVPPEWSIVKAPINSVNCWDYFFPPFARLMQAEGLRGIGWIPVIFRQLRGSILRFVKYVEPFPFPLPLAPRLASHFLASPSPRHPTHRKKKINVHAKHFGITEPEISCRDVIDLLILSHYYEDQ